VLVDVQPHMQTQLTLKNQQASLPPILHNVPKQIILKTIIPKAALRQQTLPPQPVAKIFLGLETAIPLLKTSQIIPGHIESHYVSSVIDCGEVSEGDGNVEGTVKLGAEEE
jgi:hypothetical protein